MAPADQQLIFGEVWHHNDVEPVGRAQEAHSMPESPPDDQPIRPLTQQLIDCCYLDTWPSIATIVDFGIDTGRHLGALQFAIREGLVTPQELDAATGNGPQLTEIAHRGQNPYGDVVFKTSWDGMPIEPRAFPDQERMPHEADQPSHSITAAILDNPKAFLTQSQQQDGNDRGHDKGQDRGR